MRPREEQPVIELILRDIEDGPATAKDLEESMGVNRRNIRPYIKILHQFKKIHIGGWEQRTGPALPVWFYGPGRDKPRPPKKYKRRGLLRNLTDEILPALQRSNQPTRDRQQQRPQGVQG